MKPFDFEAMVIGGGPAGATAARVLANSGISTLLVERDMKRNKLCGGGLVSTAFDEFGLDKGLINKRVYDINIASPSGNRVSIPLTGAFLAIVNRKEFDGALRDAARGEGANVIEGEFMGFYTKDSKIVISIRTGGDTVQYCTKYLIGADGVNSRVRKVLTGSFSRRLFTLQETVAGLQTDHCELRFGSSFAPGYYAWLFPHHDGCSIGTGALRAAEVPNLLDNYLKAHALHSSGATRGYYIPLWEDRVYYKNNVLLTGDAAGQVLPFTFEGIYYSMKSAEFAALAVAEGKPEAYKRLWRERFRKRFLIMKMLQTFFLKNDAMAETLVAIHQRPEVKEASQKLWLKKDSHTGSLYSYFKHVSKLVRSLLH
ncbi:MAG: geranylgeranyl reductase family protein [Nitrospirae bacterium]|nr:geranylgeranyl reductase family protein [Nitrospirota bacterium]